MAQKANEDVYALYLDVAGDPYQPMVCAGGFLAKETVWTAFSAEWESALLANGLTAPFHMTQFERIYKNRPDHWDILRSLIDVIAKHALASFSNCINMEDYLRVNSKYPLEEMYGKPYGVAATSAVTLVHHWRSRHRHLGIMKVFVEGGTLHHGDMEECFRRDGLAAPTSVPKEHPAAQAADLYSWERAWYNNTTIHRPSMVYIKQKMPDGMRGHDGKWDKRAMEQALRKLDMPHRKALPDGLNFVFNNSPKRVRKRSL